LTTRKRKPVVRRGDTATATFRNCLPLFQALGDRWRQDIILLLDREGTLNVNQIAGRIPLSRPTISHHLKILRTAGIVSAVRRGTENYYSLQITPAVKQLKTLVRQVERYC
jgi:DNA-binding transcriptional ArsR family regulator